MKRTKEILLAILKSKALKYIIVIIAGVVVVGFMDDNSIVSHLRNKERINHLKEEINQNMANHKRDQKKLETLETDDKVVEQIAREKYYMKKPDEDIFVLSSDKKE